MRTLVTGGVKSGKSSYALVLAQEFAEPRFFLATAEAFDDEMRARIARSTRSLIVMVVPFFSLRKSQAATRYGSSGTLLPSSSNQRCAPARRAGRNSRGRSPAMAIAHRVTVRIEAVVSGMSSTAARRLTTAGTKEE